MMFSKQFLMLPAIAMFMSGLALTGTTARAATPDDYERVFHRSMDLREVGELTTQNPWSRPNPVSLLTLGSCVSICVICGRKELI